MLEKRHGRRTPLPTHNSPSPYHESSRARTRRSVIIYVTIVILIFYGVLFGIPSAFRKYPASSVGLSPESQATPTSGTRVYSQSSQAPLANGTGNSLVPLEAHIMSKCPDARDCLRDMVVPAMEQISDKVDFQLSYIGSVDGEGNIECKHGPTECLGNMMGLCAEKLYPTDVKRWLGFSTCLIMSYDRIPDKDLAKGCALEHGIDFERLNACMSEEGTGLDLLESSVQRSEAAGVTKSCTVRVAGNIWCIRDGGVWKDCPGGSSVDDLVKGVEKQYEDD